jgi:hypothetical protein
MDLFEARLRRLEIDYEETIAAGERAEQRKKLEAMVAEHRAQYQAISEPVQDSETCGIDTPILREISKHESTVPEPIPPRVVKPMSETDIERVKNHMASIKLKHQPSWASNLSDDQLLAIMRRIVDS